MYASNCLVGQVVTYQGSLYQICGRPGKVNPGYVEAVNEQGKLELINYTYCWPFTRFKDLIEEIESGEREDCLQWFFIPNSLRTLNL